MAFSPDTVEMDEYGKYKIYGKCKSTDTKPTQYLGSPVSNGSVILEMDTSKLFYFDGDTGGWDQMGGGA